MRCWMPSKLAHTWGLTARNHWDPQGEGWEAGQPGEGMWGLVGGLALRELGAKPGVEDVHADKGREEVWVWCKLGSEYTGAEGKIRRGEESYRGEAPSASTHAGYKV